jgi:hydrogenase expression/formation protein HypC
MLEAFGAAPHRGLAMCLGIVGQIVALSEEHPELASVDVAGATRDINIMMLAEDGLQSGDWILIHAGFAMEKIDEETAREQMAALREYTGEPEIEDAEEE